MSAGDIVSRRGFVKTASVAVASVLTARLAMGSPALIVPKLPLLGISPNAQSFMDRQLTPSIAPRETLIAAVIDGFNAQSINVDACWLVAGAEQGIAFTNLFGDSPRITWPIGFEAFTVDRGVTPGGASSYIETNFNPSTAAYFTRNSGCCFLWLVNGSAPNNVLNNSAGGTGITIDFSGGHLKWKHNDGSATSGDDAGAIAYADGLYVLNRTASNAKTLDYNGSQIGSASTASEEIPNGTIQSQPANVFTIAVLGFCQALSSGQRTALYSSILQPYMHGIGAA